jgi:hypothetical protein
MKLTTSTTTITADRRDHSMASDDDNSKVFYHLADQTPGQSFDVFGPTVEF